MNQIRNKFIDLAALGAGWYFGRGSAISPNALSTAERFDTYSMEHSFRNSDVLPRFNGGVQLIIYRKNMFMELSVDPDGTSDIYVEHEGIPRLSKEGLNPQNVEKFIEFWGTQWAISESSTLVSGLRVKTVSEALPLKTMERAYLLLGENASTKTVKRFAVTLVGVTQLEETPKSSLKYQTENSPETGSYEIRRTLAVPA